MVKVKTEPDDREDVQLYTVNIDSIMTGQEFVCNNDTSEILSLKKLNNDMFYELQKGKESNRSMRAANESLHLKLCSVGKEKDRLQAVNKELQSKLLSTQDDKRHLEVEIGTMNLKLSSTQKEKQRLFARCQELQKGINQSQICVEQLDDKEHDGYYEVDQILDHKMKRKIRCYLVRWANYDPSYDSWVPETDLNCGDILDGYKKMRNLN